MAPIIAISTTSAAGSLAASIGIGFMLLWGAVALFYAIIPVIIVLQLSWLNAKLKNLSDDLENKAKTETAWSMDVAVQLKAQNALTRQLLRAYGHDPEA